MVKREEWLRLAEHNMVQAFVMQILGREGGLSGRLPAVCQSTSPLNGRSYSRDAGVDMKLGWLGCTEVLWLLLPLKPHDQRAS